VPHADTIVQSDFDDTDKARVSAAEKRAATAAQAASGAR
jgi:hypothetical protein